jgi:hypothetical protein
VAKIVLPASVPSIEGITCRKLNLRQMKGFLLSNLDMLSGRSFAPLTKAVVAPKLLEILFFDMASKNGFGVAALASLSIVSCGTSVFAAPISFDLTAPTQTTNPSATETSGGVTLTIKDALGTGQPTVASSVGSGGINQDLQNGLCAAFRTGSSFTGPNKCQYLNTTTAGLTGFTLQFDTPVKLSSFQIFRPGGTTFGSLAFTAGSTTETLTFSNPGGAEVASGTAFSTLSFANPFYVAANVPILVDTSATQYLSGETGSFRINNFTVDVPGAPAPVPVIGAFAAFAASRRLRNRINLSK